MLILHLHQDFQLFRGEAFLVDDGAAGIRYREDLRTEHHGLFHRVERDVAGTGHTHSQSFEGASAGLEHLLGKVNGSIASGFGPDE